MSEWIDAKVKKPPLYIDVLVIDDKNNQSVGRYMGHSTFTHDRYPVLGQAKITHWRFLPEPPKKFYKLDKDMKSFEVDPDE